MSSPVEFKVRLRRELRARLAALTDDELVAGKMGVFAQFQASQILLPHDVLLGFYPHKNEIDCRYFLRVWLADEKELLLPSVAADGLTLQPLRVPHILAVVPGYKGYMEPDLELCDPADVESIDAVLLPGLAFDTAGTRLGQGLGHYDRLLARLRPDVLKVALAYDWQLLDAAVAPLPREEHDQPVDYVCTPTRLLKCASRKTT